MAVDSLIILVGTAIILVYLTIHQKVKYIASIFYIVIGTSLLLFKDVTGGGTYEQRIGAIFAFIIIAVGFITLALDLIEQNKK